jgi:hypothetical protein
MGVQALRQLIILPVLALTACATIGGQGRHLTPPRSNDASVITWTRLYCTPDNESHFETVSAPLEAINFAPPASPIFIGGGGPAGKTVFGGFEPNWGAEDVRTGKTHPTPMVQWVTVLSGSMMISTTDGDSRLFRPGDLIHLEDVAPCRGHITQNLAAGATFLQFVQ